MHIELRVPNTVDARLPARTYDPVSQDIRAILSDVCRAVEQEVQFVVSGFGQDRWPVDVRTDLAVLMEQVPSALHAVKSGVDAEIFFYEQGVQRQIFLSPVGDDIYLASCVSYTMTWDPEPAVEQLDRTSLEQMLIGVQDNFMSLVRRTSPELAEHEWVRSWLARG